MFAKMILVGVIVLGFSVGIIIQDFKTYQNERNDINEAKQISGQNQAVGNIVNIENSTTGLKTTGNLVNSQLLSTKPVSYKIVEFSGGTTERDIANKYAEAVKIVLEENPNVDVNCSLLSETDQITYDDCLTVHDKEYDFFHKTNNDSLAYDVENENIKKYVIQIEANRYNLKTNEVNTDDKIVLDKRFVNPNNIFLDRKNAEILENTFNNIKSNLNNKNFLLASSDLYKLKKNNYQDIPIISSLYAQLIEDVETKTKDSTIGSEDYDLRLKVQSEFLKLTRVSNIMENLKSNNSVLVNNFIDSVATNYSTIENIELTLSRDNISNVLPTKNDFINQLSKFKN